MYTPLAVLSIAAQLVMWFAPVVAAVLLGVYARRSTGFVKAAMSTTNYMEVKSNFDAAYHNYQTAQRQLKNYVIAHLIGLTTAVAIAVLVSYMQFGIFAIALWSALSFLLVELIPALGIVLLFVYLNAWGRQLKTQTSTHWALMQQAPRPARRPVMPLYEPEHPTQPIDMRGRRG